MIIDVNPEVAHVLSEKQAVVALESTIITHGMPAPENLDTALALESVIREVGAVPATIAVLDGVLKIGLTPRELERLAFSKEVLKLSRADLPVAMVQKVTGSTTVAATMIAAAKAGISFFATGGIGGVHRGGENSMDISADLGELAFSPVTVICAGAKAILDIPRTLEYLETSGVPVVGYQCDEVPAFWSRSSGVPSPIRFDSIVEIIEFIRIRESLQLQGGVLVTNPVPRDDEIPAVQVESWIAAAIKEADSKQIDGKALTPFLLSTINQLSDGASLRTNISLVKNNACLAALLALSYTSGAHTPQE